MTRRIFAILAATVIGASAPALAGPQGRITGAVTDVRTGAGIDGAIVEVAGLGLTATSGPDGAFEIGPVPDGSHRIRARSVRYREVQTQVRVEGGAADRPITFALAPAVLRLDEAGSVTASRDDRATFDIPRSVTVVQSADLESTSPRTSAEARRALPGGWTLVTGVEVYRDTVRSWRRDDELAGGASVERRGQFPDGATALFAGGFGLGHFRRGRFTADLGARYTWTRIQAEDALFGDTDVRTGAWVGSAAASFDLGAHAQVFGSAAEGVRAPNLDDLSTLGPIDFGVEIPAGSLEPERFPPLNGLIGVRHEAGKGWWLEGYLQAAGLQDRLAGGDIDDHRIPPGGTPGWWVVDAFAGRTFNRYFTISAGLLNLFNEAYRTHGSGIDGYGRSAWIGVDTRF